MPVVLADRGERCVESVCPVVVFEVTLSIDRRSFFSFFLAFSLYALRGTREFCRFTLGASSVCKILPCRACLSASPTETPSQHLEVGMSSIPSRRVRPSALHWLRQSQAPHARDRAGDCAAPERAPIGCWRATTQRHPPSGGQPSPDAPLGRAAARRLRPPCLSSRTVGSLWTQLLRRGWFFPPLSLPDLHIETHLYCPRQRSPAWSALWLMTPHRTCTCT